MVCSRLARSRRDVLRFGGSTLALLAYPPYLSLQALAQSSAESVRGILGLNPSGKPVLVATEKQIPLTSDEPTMAVFLDKRVHGMEFELTGKFLSNGLFSVGPIHTKAMYVLRKDLLHKDQRLFVTYWCDVCSIRTYSPGTCWCCQEETELDIRERYDN